MMRKSLAPIEEEESKIMFMSNMALHTENKKIENVSKKK